MQIFRQLKFVICTGLKASTTIFQKIFASLLICIFAFSITPSIAIHNLFAHHTDKDIQHHHAQTNEVATAGYNCHFDNLVCEGSFLSSINIILEKPVVTVTIYRAAYSKSFYSLHHFFTELRGPPFSA